jgi:Winged helix DNA-binding domain
LITVTAAQERGYLAHRHGLHPAGPPMTIAQLAAAHAGLHAARLPTPYVTLRARLPGFAAKELRGGLEPGGGLIKLRTCRRTLHIYPLADAPAAHAATHRLRLGACAATLRRLGFAPKILTRFTPAVHDALATGPLPHRDLEREVLAATARVRVRRAARTELVRLAIKWMWEDGELLYRNTANSLHREIREFHLTTQAHPQIQLNDIDPATAVRTLLRHYLTAFGPASIDDFHWWSGLNLREITPAIAGLRPDLVDIRIEGQPAGLLLLAEHEPDLLAAEPLPPNHIRLLAHEDPALKGYFTTRHRYVDDPHRELLFNSIGEARASITMAGRCIGTWQFHRTTRTIDHHLYTQLSTALHRAITDQLDEMTDFLRTEPC